MVGRIFTEHRATFAQLDMKKTLKVVGRFIHNDAAGMKRIFAKAEAKIEARNCASVALKLVQHDGPISHDLHCLNSIIAYAAFLATPSRHDNPDFRVALFDAAWKESAGKGKLNIILKKRGGSVDGTKFLKSDLRRLAKTGDLERLQPATKLAALLDAIKKHGADAPTTDTKEEFWTDYPAAIAELGKLGAKPPDDIEITALTDLLGKALTESLHPKIKLASQLDAAKHRQEIESSYDKLSSQIALKMFREFFELFSSEKMWSRNEVKVSLYEYYGLALNIVALEKLCKKQNITKQDIALLKTTLKDAPIPSIAGKMEFINQRAGADLISDSL